MPPCTGGLPQVWRKPRETYCEVSVMLALSGEGEAACSGGTVAVTCGTGATATVVSALPDCACAATAWHSSSAPVAAARQGLWCTAERLHSMNVSPWPVLVCVAG